VHIPPENWKLGHTISLFQKYRWILSWEELVHLVVGMHEHQGERWFSEPPTDLVNDLVATSEENQTLSEILDQLYRFHGDQQSVAFNRWGDKTPMNVRFMHSILDVFPEAKFIYMSRDVVDVVHSWIQTGYYDEVEDPALRWKRAAKNAEEFSSQYPDRLIRIRYEHLVRDPTQSVKHVCNFVGVSFDPSMLERRSEGKVASEIDKHDHYAAVNDPISDKNIGKGHKNMPEKIKKKIHTIVRDK
jgi:hypothetical protein